MINNIVYLYNDKEDFSKLTVRRISEKFAQTMGTRNLVPISLYDGESEPNIDTFIDNLRNEKVSCELVLIDFVGVYARNRSSLFNLLSKLDKNRIRIPWILLNGVPEDNNDIINDLKNSYPEIVNIRNLKYIHNSQYCEKIIPVPEENPFEVTSKSILEDIEELEKNDFLRSAISGEQFIKTVHIPGFKIETLPISGFKDLAETPIAINLTNGECTMPDYFILGGDYLLSNEDDRITVIFKHLVGTKDSSKILYTKSCCDEDSMFDTLMKEGQIHPSKIQNNDELTITPFIIREEKMPITILNICFHKINESNPPELSELDYNAIVKKIEDRAYINNSFKTDIKIIYCHYDLFHKNGKLKEFNNKLEQYLKTKKFFILIHDHTHDIENFDPKYYINLDNTQGDDKIGIPRIAGGYFDNPKEGSNLFPFYLSFNFIYDKINKPHFIKYFDFKIWKSQAQDKKENFIFNKDLTEEFKNLFGELTQNPINVVILTAIQEEFDAVKSHLKNVVTLNKGGTTYRSGEFELNRIKIANVFIRECGKGNLKATLETERAIKNFRPDLLFFVGIAGSRKDFSLSDVVFANKIYSYETLKSELDSELTRPDAEHPSKDLLNIATDERNKTDWKILIDEPLDREFRADIGVIASGEQTIENYNSQTGELITKNYNDTQAIDMEGFGFLSTARDQGTECKDMLYGVIRGISDILGRRADKIAGSNNNNKPEITESNNRNDENKKYASKTAAAFAYWLVFKVHEKKINESNNG